MLPSPTHSIARAQGPGFLSIAVLVSLSCACPGSANTSATTAATTGETTGETTGGTLATGTTAGDTATSAETDGTQTGGTAGETGELMWPIDVQGHRGNRGNVPPGNTIASFESALALGVTTLEGDMQITADMVVVMGHDDDLTETGCAWAGGGDAPTNLVSKMTADEVAQWDCHPELDGVQPPPRLPQALALDDAVHFNFEFKRTGEPEVDIYMPALLAYNAQCGNCLDGRMTVQSFNWGDLEYARSSYDGIWGPNKFRVAALGLAPKLDDIAEAAAYAEIWSPHEDIVTPEIIVQVQALGLQVIPWTVNDAQAMQSFIDMGVDGIITDYPDVLIGLLSG